MNYISDYVVGRGGVGSVDCGRDKSCFRFVHFLFCELIFTVTISHA